MTTEIPEDDMELLLLKLMSNADLAKPVVNLLEKFKEAGGVDVLSEVVNNYLPTDLGLLAKMFTSKEFVLSLLKTMNTMVSFLGAFSSEQTSDLVKAVMFNFDNITDNVMDSIKNPSKYSPLKISKVLSDPDIMTGMSAMLAFLKGLGQILREKHP